MWEGFSILYKYANIQIGSSYHVFWILHHVNNIIQVAMARVFHLFPFRTEKLSPVTPMVLRPSGRVGSCLLVGSFPYQLWKTPPFYGCISFFFYISFMFFISLLFFTL